ncbi:hypothetical protein M885DRAFT_504206 [Pelagophyceae sp. CCMP2097]|nr:hypothetical protein M885DRAFT_504206 [Pelagophyceae sp. CCMP2097]
MQVALLIALAASAVALQPLPVRKQALTRRRAEDAASLMEEAAKMRAEAIALEASFKTEAPPPAAPAPAAPGAAKEAVTAALKKATLARDKDQLQIALAAAEETGLFSGKDEVIQKALRAYNELKDLSDSMRSKLVAEARSQGGDPSTGTWNPGNAYVGVFVAITVLVLIAGKDILY